MKIKLTDLKIGQKVMLFNSHYKQMNEGTIVAITASKYNLEDGTFTALYNVDGISNAVECELYAYKAAGSPRWRVSFWCFANSTRFINHIQNVLWHPAVKKVDNSKYADLPHDNNKNQLEKTLIPQRNIAGKILENGYIWYRTVPDCSLVRWHIAKDPKVTFDKESKKYYVKFNNYEIIKLTNYGKSFLLEKPDNIYE